MMMAMDRDVNEFERQGPRSTLPPEELASYASSVASPPLHRVHFDEVTTGAQRIHEHGTRPSSQKEEEDGDDGDVDGDGDVAVDEEDWLVERDFLGAWSLSEGATSGMVADTDAPRTQGPSLSRAGDAPATSHASRDDDRLSDGAGGAQQNKGNELPSSKTSCNGCDNSRKPFLLRVSIDRTDSSVRSVPLVV